MPISPYFKRLLRVLVAILIGLPMLAVLGIQVIMLNRQQEIMEQITTNKQEVQDNATISKNRIEEKTTDRWTKTNHDDYMKELKRLNPNLVYPEDR